MQTKRPFYVTILGDGAVGKTTLVKLLMNNEFNIADLKTKRTPFLEVEILKINKEKLLIYDLAGQDNLAHPLRVLEDQVLGHAHLIIFAFALDRFSSLAHLGSWYLPIKDYYVKKNKNLPKMILVGTKADQARKLDRVLIDKVLSSTKIKEYVPTSSVSGDGIPELKQKLFSLLSEEPNMKFAFSAHKAVEAAPLLN
ncbi:MAG: GTPase Era [Candidatus Heimdallarchaeota archaeon LC_3]|nr:MAG: GTPase Era [Candidatus Heimdallarchaeota archaeon LC_3]